MAASVFLFTYLFLNQPHACMAGYTTFLCPVNGLQVTCWASILSMQTFKIREIYK